MNILELGAIGELLGGVAVIATLVYVGLQVRQNTLAMRSMSHHAISDSFNAINLAFARDADLARIFRAGNGGRANLTEDERVQYDFIHMAIFRTFETHFYQSHSGAFHGWESRPSVESLISSVGGQEWWRVNPYRFSPEFSRYVKSCVVEVGDGKDV